MPSFLEAIEEATNAVACAFFTGATELSPYWRGIRYMRGGISVPIGGIGAQAAAGIMSAVCPDVPATTGFPRVPDGSAPGDGVFGDGTGECPEQYAIVVSAQAEYTPGPVSGTPQYTYGVRYFTNVTGPLSNLNFEIPGQVVGGIANNSGPPLRFFIGTSGPFGMTVLDNDDPTNKGQGTNRVIGPVVWESAQLTGGGEDNCGQPALPPSSGPPTPGPTTPTDVTYDDENGNPITTPVDITIQPPIVDGGGNVIIPTLVVAPNFDLNVNINASLGGVKIELPGIGPQDCCTLPERPDENPPENEEPEPEPEGDEVIVGVTAVVQTAPNNLLSTRVFGTEVPDAYFPDVGVIMFARNVGAGVAWSKPIRVQNRRQYIPCPFPNGAIKVDGITRPEVTWQLVPERAIIEP